MLQSCQGWPHQHGCVSRPDRAGQDARCSSVCWRQVGEPLHLLVTCFLQDCSQRSVTLKYLTQEVASCSQRPTRCVSSAVSPGWLFLLLILLGLPLVFCWCVRNQVLDVPGLWISFRDARRVCGCILRCYSLCAATLAECSAGVVLVCLLPGVGHPPHPGVP
jgi:hypothetical protein